jgi:hypothetical protein
MSIWRIAESDDMPRVREEAQCALRVILNGTPALADTVLAAVAKTATTDDIYSVRREALLTLKKIVATRPDLTDAILAADSARMEIEFELRPGATLLLESIVRRRPDLAPSAFKIVKNFFDEVPDASYAVHSALRMILWQRPDLADATLINTVMRTRSKHRALGTLRVIVSKRPELADKALVQSVIDIARTHLDDRTEAHRALQMILSLRPDLADTALVADVAQTAELDDNAEVRSAAYRTLQVVLEQRPDFAERLIAALNSSASSGAEDDPRRGEIEYKSFSEALAHYVPKDIVRIATEETLQVIAQHRPDLVQSDPNRRLALLIYSLKELADSKGPEPDTYEDEEWAADDED